MGKKFVINVFDRRYFGHYDKENKFVAHTVPDNKSLITPKDKGFENIIIHVNERMTPEAVVNKIQAEIHVRGGSDGDVQSLRLFGHGRAGYLELGTGLHDYNFAAFEKLKGLLDPHYGKVELHGCWNASASLIHGNCPTPGTMTLQKGKTYDFGYNLLHVASRALHAPALGGINCQVQDPQHNFEGPVRSVFWMNRYWGPNVPQAAKDFLRKKKITLPDPSFPKPFQPHTNPFALKHEQIFREPFAHRNDWIRQGKINLPDVSLKKNLGSPYAPRSPFDNMPKIGTSYTGKYPSEFGNWAKNLIRSGGIKLPDVSLRKTTLTRPPSYGLPPIFVSPLEPPHWAGDLLKRGGIKLPDVSLRPTPPF